eukprot:CCRYP_003489-RA/>CCRYP_003489-RA protein AED:0.04 eAED:0.04 QI:38/1/1/1/1/0.8/5/181/732
MGCSSSKPASKQNNVSTGTVEANAASHRVAPQAASSCQRKPNRSDKKNPFDMISDLTQNRPLDACDVVSVPEAKAEIAAIRRYAKQFLDSMAVVDGIDAATSGVETEVFEEKNRVALYDKQDFTKYKKESYPKTDEIKAFIFDAIRPNPLFENDEEDELIELIDLFKPVSFNAGQCVIKQGDKGDQFYVVESGELSIKVATGENKEKQSMKVGQYSKGAAFGELALIFDSPRAATVTATTDVKLWCLDRQAYRLRIGQIRYHQREEKLNFIRKCKIRGRDFCNLFDASQLEDLSIAIKSDHYKKGSVILRRGEVNDTLYIVRSGKVNKYIQVPDGAVGTVNEGQAFGTNALLTTMASPETYIAATDVVLYYLTHNDFETMIGTMQDVLDGNSVTRSMMRSSSRHTMKTSMTMDQRYTNITLQDLNFFNVLGRGAFGKVILVQSKANKKVFALKAQSKHFILKKGQTEHVLNEYRIMKRLDHPNILNIHCAMQDDRYLFFLLDLHPGGELMSYLMKRKRFPESFTRFYAASVLLAFEEMHSLEIAYRDLKPENVVLDKNGFGILVDFGLAKVIDDGHTYTFCGTPDYLAPEVIRGTGHDWAIDYWGLGIFLFELTNGCAPFFATTQLRRTRKILKGYEFVDVPPHFSRGLKDLIAKLLENDPARRLGRAQSGIQAIKKHIFFAGFDWEGRSLHHRYLLCAVMSLVKLHQFSLVAQVSLKRKSRLQLNLPCLMT